FVWNNSTDRDLTVYRHTSSDELPIFPYETVGAALFPHSAMNMNLEWYFANITDEESAAALLREKGVFHRERSCLSCHQQMQLGSRRSNGSPQWKCTDKACGARISARTGTWFEGCRNRLSLQKAIGLILARSDKMSSMRFCKKHLGTPSPATVANVIRRVEESIRFRDSIRLKPKLFP
ncbi:hypothetical protein M513_13388, partial [Trichuris suis]